MHSSVSLLLRARLIVRSMLRSVTAWGFLALGPTAIAQHFNLAADFDFDQNPGGPWAYLSQATPVACPYDNGSMRGWCCFASLDASITKFVGPPTFSAHDAQVGDVVVHASSSMYPGPMSIAWTAPSPGTITISGRAWDAHFQSERQASWELSLNGVSLASRGFVRGTFRDDPGAQFANNVTSGQSLGGLQVAAGDTVEWTTHALTTYGHLVGVEIDVNYRACPADFDGDGTVDFFDYDAFVVCFEDPDCSIADFDADGTVDFFDYDAFVVAFETGC